MKNKERVSLFTCYYESPIGLLLLQANESSLMGIRFVEVKSKRERINAILNKSKLQLDEYFRGERKRFNLSLEYNGTTFQTKVWEALMRIDYGETVSYKKVAESIKHRKAYRAVGSANNKNRIPIIIPCHRVIGSKGEITGYAGGIWRKKWLLDHEKKY